MSSRTVASAASRDSSISPSSFMLVSTFAFMDCTARSERKEGKEENRD